jgi:catechol 2,3-dioxygenase-like lactoylglutathione lyase family enzyme
MLNDIASAAWAAQLTPSYVRYPTTFYRVFYMSRTIEFVGNNELALHVADPVAATEFYVKVLGCRLIDPNPECVELETGVLRLFILRDPAPMHEPLVPSFSVPDRAAALTELQAAGCTLIPIGPHSPGEHYVRDPNGVLFDLVEKR